jgi:hypothetical protein
MRRRAGASGSGSAASMALSGFVWMRTLFTDRSMIRTIVNRLVNKNTRENPRIKGMELTGDILIGAPREKVWTGSMTPKS